MAPEHVARIEHTKRPDILVQGDQGMKRVITPVSVSP